MGLGQNDATALRFLFRNAARSAWLYARSKDTRNRFVGNVLIAVGAILPGIGGTFTRFGYTEVLYVTEFIGLAMIFLGYRAVVSPPAYLMTSHAMDAISPSA